MLITLLLTLTTLDPAHRLISDELGLEMALPPGTLVVQRPSEAGNHFILREGGETPRWSLRVESIEAPAQGANAILGTLVSARRGDHPDALVALEHDGSEHDGRESAQGWFVQSLPDGRQAVLGWFVAPQALGRCLVCTAVTTPEHLAVAQDAVNTSFRTVEFRDELANSTALSSALTLGRQALATIDQAALEAAVGTQRVLRVYDPAAGKEIAYGTLEVSTATRAAIKQAGQAQANATDQEEGLLVTVHLRFATDAQADEYVDRLGRFWVSWDLQREAWTDMATTRRGDNRSMQLELGFREAPSLNQPRGLLQVVRQDDAASNRDSWSFEVGDTWLPRPLRWILPEVMDARPASRLAWWTWDSTSPVPRITVRRDTWSDDGRRQLTWQGFDGLPTVTSLDPRGAMRRARRPDGTVVEVSDEATVRRVWQEAGLKLR